MIKSTRSQRIRWTIPFILFLTTILDSALPAVFPVAFLGHNQVIIPHLTLYWIVTFAFFLRDSSILPWSFLAGLFYDGYNTTFLGLYGVIYLITTYIIHKSKKFFPHNVWIHLMLFIVAISFVDILVYLFYSELGVTQLAGSLFLVNRLGPTLIFNIVAFILLYFPTNSLLGWLGYTKFKLF
ncbi:rod shape-determining protein MreD [Hutsoniella sourekii]